MTLLHDKAIDEAGAGYIYVLIIYDYLVTQFGVDPL